MKRNWLRRSLGIAACGVPFSLLVASLIVAATSERASEPFAVFWLAGVALGFAILNFTLSFIRPLWITWVRRQGPARHVSGFPLLGNLFAVLAGIFGFGAAGTSLVALIALILDTGGLIWFVAMTWRDEGFWDS